METKFETLTKQDRLRHVQLLILGTDGGLLGTLGSVNPSLADLLSIATQMDGFPVTKKTDEMLLPTAQDCYQVDRDFVLSVRGLFTEMTWPEILSLERILPQVASYIFVVSY